MVRQIELTQDQVALVDKEDYDWLMQYKWFAVRFNNAWYAVRKRRKSEGKPGLIFLHREIMDNPPNQVDHINGNGLDDQRSNLREATHSQNQMNNHTSRGSSQYKGVSWKPRDHKWQAQIQVNNIDIYLGYFDNEVDAARAYDQASLEHFGEFANPNF